MDALAVARESERERERWLACPSLRRTPQDEDPPVVAQEEDPLLAQHEDRLLAQEEGGAPHGTRRGSAAAWAKEMLGWLAST